MDGKNVDFCWEWRPLAGIKKIWQQHEALCEKLEFPSPRGDKENPDEIKEMEEKAKFPSPHGDKENPRDATECRRCNGVSVPSRG